jgi:predicted amidohydrolase YtcJ
MALTVNVGFNLRIRKFQENEKGSITPGKLADIVLLSDDIFSIDPGRIRDTKVLKTFVGGKLVYDVSAAVK